MVIKLSEKARLERNKYARKWRAANQGKVKEANIRYWLKKAKEVDPDNEKASDKR